MFFPYFFLAKNMSPNFIERLIYLKDVKINFLTLHFSMRNFWCNLKIYKFFFNKININNNLIIVSL